LNLPFHEKEIELSIQRQEQPLGYAIRMAASAIVFAVRMGIG
jgi:hypothetical protein